MDEPWKRPYLGDLDLCKQVNRRNDKEEICVCRELDESCVCRELGIVPRCGVALHDNSKTLEDHSPDIHVVSDADRFHCVVPTEDIEVHASILGVESNTPEAEDDDDNDDDKNEATERDVPLRFTVCDAGYYRRCYILRYYTVLAFAYLLGVAGSVIVETPKNAVISKEESLYAIHFPCKSSCQCRLKWYLHKSQHSGKEILYNGYALRPDAKHYCTAIADGTGNCNLNLTTAEEAAQTYICLEPGTLLEASADLIWIGDRIRHASLTEDLINLTCSIEFRGNWAPIIEWTEHNSTKVISIGVNTTTVPNQLVTSTLVIPVLNGSRSYTCTTKFDLSGKPPTTTSINVPDYNVSWTHFGYDPTCKTICGDDFVQITCVIGFHGHSVPMIEWMQCNGTDERISGVSDSSSTNEILNTTIHIKMMKNSSSNGFCYKLTATFKEDGLPLETDADSISSHNHTIIFNYNFDTLCSTMKYHNNALMNGMVIGCAAIVIIVILLYCCCCRKKRYVPLPNWLNKMNI